MSEPLAEAEPIRIEYLVDAPGAVPALAEWHQAQWGRFNPANTVERRVREFAAHMGRVQVPTTFVALEGDRPVGSASLIDCDLQMRRDLKPWLASVYVVPDRRDRAIGSMLVERVVQEAWAVGFPVIHLFTPDRQSFYLRMGWTELETALVRERPVFIMKLDRPPGESGA